MDKSKCFFDFEQFITRVVRHMSNYAIRRMRTRGVDCGRHIPLNPGGPPAVHRRESQL